MYKLIIVDDEERIRNGLKKFINWAGLGFDCVADFEDGADAMQYLQHHETDVVLTDIRMAQLSGIELARYVFEQRPRVKVVINSGYAQFEYAKRAIEYKVEHYLIKPTNVDEMRQVFTNIRTALDQERLGMFDDFPARQGHFLEQREHAKIRRHHPYILEGMRAGSSSIVIDHFNLLLDDILQSRPDLLYLLVIDLFTEIANAFKEFDLFRLTGGRFDYRLLTPQQSPADIRRWGEQVLQDTISCLSKRNQNNPSSLLQQAQTFIEANYTKDLSLEEVASSVYVSSTYFSRYYKQQTGETFVEALTRIRLNKAVELLKLRKYKIYEISEMVGYQSSKYFNRQFKQGFGYTPKEYVRLILIGSDLEDE
ncbi:response regulator [Paenibacillus sp. HWE-109]|uniref:response regulator n=1 Tax=Paenibacillus sp. HWE-109 TaxID=1306526 RepID=UPI001EDF70F3|nr:response regulator [Paenibacillus sp. HWE-109]UKS27892.1 response regulator [Paenibacillus sp. HWE-109]